MTQNDQTNNQQSQFPVPGRAVIYTRPAHSQLPTPQPQTNELEAFAKEHGFTQITVFEEGYVSGKAATREREALNALLIAITQPEPNQEPTRAIFANSEDRLFRDATSADITAFIETCRAHGVLLITPLGEYDFTNPAHVAYFRFKVEQAYQFVTQMITSRLQAGKRAAAARRKAAN